MQVFEPNDICPGCYSRVTTHKCSKCKATRSVNAASGREIWMRNGIVVKGGVFPNSRVANFTLKKRLLADKNKMAAYEGTQEPAKVVPGAVKPGEAGSSVAPTESTSEDKLDEWKAQGSPKKVSRKKKKSEK